VTASTVRVRKLDELRGDVDVALEHRLNRSRLRESPRELSEAIRYAALAKGKRIRPLLLIAAHECCGGPTRDALPLACAVEIIHAASLVHDDLPVMDDHALRRSRPSLHRVEGEAVAILSGVAMVAYAFQIVAESNMDGHTAAVVQALSRAVGCAGMCGGQLADLKLDKAAPSAVLPGIDELETLYRRKTGALMVAAAEIGALAAGAKPPLVAACRTFGDRFGLAFQIIDDIRDIEADQMSGRPTFATLCGVSGAAERARAILDEGEAAVGHLGSRAELFTKLNGTLRERLRSALP
jgi:geranylgeranyl diphosphate synthase type II